MEFAGDRAFERGADYFADGYVVGLKQNNAAIQATVRGTYYYRVRLWANETASFANIVLLWASHGSTNEYKLAASSGDKPGAA